ncbi:glycoside hydrolase family 127 protein [Rathayibacter soli]|uniref:glycoside hydrolase family 127 protein n=1 Tax=Rathayibacter soli TaxID=3144168 RepID=UPI0027E46F6E|nr:beta-L-arabinofuranosidase domain-containing protein [Glaciibacter superstes]
MTTVAGPMSDSRLGVVRPVGGGHVRLGDGVLGRWQRRNRLATIPHGIRALEAEGALDNLRRLIGAAETSFRGPVFVDSDVYKVLEGVAWELGRAEDAELRAFYEDTIVLLAQVQDEDGYLNSAFQREDRLQEWWTDFTNGHELYCAGHLIQAAVASVRALGDDRLLAIAARSADLIVRLFGGPESPAYPGHPEIEYALVELFRLTGRREYLDAAKAFVDRRGTGWLGRGAFGSSYFQDDAGLRDTTVMRGHAVRALYLNSGATDVYLETGDATLLAALKTQWEDMVTRRSYITGGTGSRHRDEAFGDAYELPSDRAYAETCAGIASMHWAWRMYVATGEAAYADFFETALYNVVADGISEDGTQFFYSNPLQLRADHASSQEEAAAHRLDWYFCACCPPNLMRTFASIESYLATASGDELQLVQYTRSRVETSLRSGRVVLEVDTDYPLDGAVRITVVEGIDGGTLALRVPGWNASRRLYVNDEPVDADDEDGWLRLPGALAAGSEIRVEFDMTPEFVSADPRVDAVRGAVALRRGPVVYCVEQSDNESDVERVRVDPEHPPVETGMRTPLGPVVHCAGAVVEPKGTALYPSWHSFKQVSSRPVELYLRPYSTWGNSTPGAMRVWVPVIRAIPTSRAVKR